MANVKDYQDKTMTSSERSNFLDATSSDEDENQGYDSAAENLQKGGRSPKRRRMDSRDGADKETAAQLKERHGQQRHEDKLEPKIVHPVVEKGRSTVDIPGISKPLTKKNLVATDRAIKKSGVVYLSRIPPFMKHTKLRSLLEPYGTINRIFLSPEDPTSHTRRVRNGGNKRGLYTDGWVEFVKKADAKHACELLNAKTIGGKKGTYYHDDVWNLLYLKGFKWHNLTEQIAAENAERASRLKAEISKTTKENKEFIQNVEKAKMLEGIEAKKAMTRRIDDEKATEFETPTVNELTESRDRARYFKQTAVALKRYDDQPEQVRRVLSKIF
jgi:ESF2/ABP1 family protein